MHICRTCKNTNQNNFIKMRTLQSKEDLMQCTNCCEIDGVIKIHNLSDNLDCCICMEIVDNINIFDCSHWICNKCYDNVKMHKCPLCRNTIKNISNIVIDKPINYFGNENKNLYIELAQLVYDKVKQFNMPILEILMEYHKFLILLANNDNNNKSIEQKLLPSDIIDIVWSTHLLDTKLYKKMCKIIGEKIIYYYPYNYKHCNLQYINCRYKYTCELFTDMFGKMDNKIWYYGNVNIKKEGVIYYIMKLEPQFYSQPIEILINSTMKTKDVIFIIASKYYYPPHFCKLLYNNIEIPRNELILDNYITLGSTIHFIVNEQPIL